MRRRKFTTEITKGIIRENPVLRLLLGICPALAVTTSAVYGIGMGLATAFVLLGSNILLSVFRNVIPSRIRIPAYITIIAGLTTVVILLIQAFSPALEAALGIFLPLIATNCIILARGEMFASKNKILPSILDALGMGIGFTIALAIIGAVRELLGAGTLFGVTLTTNVIEPAMIMLLPPGGFFVFAMLIVVVNQYENRQGRKLEQAEVGCNPCMGQGNCVKK